MARSKGAGTLIKRGRYWQCKIVVDGKPRYKATGTSSKVKAREILEEFARPFLDSDDARRLAAIEAEIRAKEDGAAEADGYASAKVSDLVEKYFKTANAPDVSQGTLDNYERQLAKFVKWLAENEPAVKTAKDVTRQVAERFLEWLKPSVSASWFNGTLATLRKIWKEFGRLSKHRCFRENPWDGYRYKSADVSTKRGLTPDEVAKLFKACATPDETTLFTVGLYTGLRVGDCATLKWESVDFERRVLRATPIKTKRHGVTVTIPMHPALFADLDKRRKSIGPDSEYVLPECAEDYLATNKCRAAVNVFARAGLGSGVSFHSLRHTFVSAAASAGVPLDVVRHIVGHTSAKMTDHYAHLSDEALSKAVNALPSVGQASARKALVEVDVKVLKELEALGLGVEEALRELIHHRVNTVTVETAA